MYTVSLAMLIDLSQIKVTSNQVTKYADVLAIPLKHIFDLIEQQWDRKLR